MTYCKYYIHGSHYDHCINFPLCSDLTSFSFSGWQAVLALYHLLSQGCHLSSAGYSSDTWGEEFYPCGWTECLSCCFFCVWSCHNSVQFSFSVMSDSWWPRGLQHARPPCSSPTARVYSNSCPLNQWSHPTISPSVILSQHQGLFQWVNSSHQVAKVLEFQLQHQSFQGTPRTDLL